MREFAWKRALCAEEAKRRGTPTACLEFGRARLVIDKILGRFFATNSSLEPQPAFISN
jgi:hypothetical protein